MGLRTRICAQSEAIILSLENATIANGRPVITHCESISPTLFFIGHRKQLALYSARKDRTFNSVDKRVFCLPIIISKIGSLRVNNKLPLGAFIICKNEASCIENCIRTLDLCSEIVIVDSGSTDGTLAILERLRLEGLPIRIFYREWTGFADQKQYALEQCTQPWVINVDCDERLDPDLRGALPGMLEAPATVGGWRIPRRPYLLGLGYTPSFVHEGRMLRLVRRETARYVSGMLVHEAMTIAGGIRLARRGTLLHFRILSIDVQIRKEGDYGRLKAEQLRQQGKRFRPLRLILSPAIYFLRYYFMRRMFLCGFPGFIQSATGAVYAFLAESRMYQDEFSERDRAEDDRRTCGL